jgi:hypothetical protein
VLKGTPLDDTLGTTGSYRLTNAGRAIITVDKMDLPKSFLTRGYFSDRNINLPYALAPQDTLVISCNLTGGERPIIETENELKKNVVVECSYPRAGIKFSYRFNWQEGLFKGKARVLQ